MGGALVSEWAWPESPEGAGQMEDSIVAGEAESELPKGEGRRPDEDP